MKTKYLFNLVFLVLLLLIASDLYSQKAISSGIKYTINDNWKFNPGGFSFAQRSQQKGFPLPIDDLWETVSVPHTWNALDPFDDAEGYRRGIGWYRKFIELDSTYVGKSIYLKFEGANQTTDVYVNGAFVGQHKGGYNQFTFDITISVNQIGILSQWCILPPATGQNAVGGVEKKNTLYCLTNKRLMYIQI